MNNDKLHNIFEEILGLSKYNSVSDVKSNTADAASTDIQNVLDDKLLLNGVLGGSSSCVKDAYATSTYRVNPMLQRTKIGKYDVEEVISNLYCALNIPIPGEELTGINLDRIRRMSADQLAYFIVHESKRTVSGGGDATEELAAWLKSKPE